MTEDTGRKIVQADPDIAAAFDAGLKVLPGNPQLLIGLAGVLERQQDYDAAISKYEQVLEQQPGNAISINNLAALLSDHRTDAASLDKAAELSEKEGLYPDMGFGRDYVNITIHVEEGEEELGAAQRSFAEQLEILAEQTN